MTAYSPGAESAQQRQRAENNFPVASDSTSQRHRGRAAPTNSSHWPSFAPRRKPCLCSERHCRDRPATTPASAIAAVPLLQIHRIGQCFAPRRKPCLCSERHCRDRPATTPASAIAAVPLLQSHHVGRAFAARRKPCPRSERLCRDWPATTQSNRPASVLDQPGQSQSPADPRHAAADQQRPQRVAGVVGAAHGLHRASDQASEQQGDQPPPTDCR